MKHSINEEARRLMALPFKQRYLSVPFLDVYEKSPFIHMEDRPYFAPYRAILPRFNLTEFIKHHLSEQTRPVQQMIFRDRYHNVAAVLRHVIEDMEGDLEGAKWMMGANHQKILTPLALAFNRLRNVNPDKFRLPSQIRVHVSEVIRRTDRLGGGTRRHPDEKGEPKTYWINLDDMWQFGIEAAIDIARSRDKMWSDEGEMESEARIQFRTGGYNG